MRADEVARVIEKTLAEREDLGAQAREALVTLKASDQALNAIAKLRLSESETRILARDCLTAARILRTHRREVERARFLGENAEGARRALQEVADYIAGSGFVVEGGADDPVPEAQRILADEIFWTERHGEIRGQQLSRRGDRAAARSRAIGWIKMSVHRLSGRPHLAEVRTLCDVALGGRPSLDAVKRARGD